MANANRNRGFGFEREIVNDAKAVGLDAVRAYASNGKSLGCAETVDLKIEDVRVQAKRRKKLASYLEIPDGADAVAFRQDRGDTLVMIRLPYFLELLASRPVPQGTV